VRVTLDAGAGHHITNPWWVATRPYGSRVKKLSFNLLELEQNCWTLDMTQHSNTKKRGKKGSKKTSTSQQKDMPSEAGTHRSQAQSESSAGDVQPAAKRNKSAVTVDDVPDEDSADKDEDGELSKASLLLNKVRPHLGITERLSEKWTSCIYAFFELIPNISYVEGRRYHAFQCAAKSCNFKSRRFLDTTDANSTGNMCRHVRKCWGEEPLNAVEAAENIGKARDMVVNALNETGSISAAFERQGKGVVTYSNRQHTRAETRVELVRWVSKSLRPFSIVKDESFHCLMKTGRPGYYIPSPKTVSRDVKQVFAKTRVRIAKLLRVSTWNDQTNS
jgi:hypothetical protein